MTVNIKLAVVGSKSSGKSALTVRFLTRRFIGEYDSNSDVCVTREMRIGEKNVDLHVKDTAGCVWLKGPSALIGWSTAIIIVYSVTDERSFELAKYILEDLNVGKRLDSVMLLGNKSDLNHLREVPYDKGRQLAQDNGVNFSETSAANDYESVSDAFNKLLFLTTRMQEFKLQMSDELLPPFVRKNSLVVRDHPRNRRSSSSVSRRTSTGSYDSMRDSISSLSDDEKSIQHDPRYSPTIEFVNNSLTSSPNLSAAGKRRKMSIPQLFKNQKPYKTR